MMDKDNDSIFSILRREPEQADLIVKVGLAGPVVIVGWGILAEMLLPAIAVSVVSFIGMLIYAGVLVYLIARLVRTADKWQVDSAMQARRLMTGDRRRLSRDEEHAPPPPLPQANFHEVHFMLRLTEEVQRARREGSEMCVLAVDVTVPGAELTPASVEKVSFELANIASGQAKVISNALSTGPTEFVFCMPHMDQAAGKDFIRKLFQGLGNYWCHFGLAVYPDNAHDAESLFNYARQQCEDSRQGVGGRTAAIA